MKLITRDTDYAIRALSCIAGTKGKTVTTSQLEKTLKVPRPFLRKILQILNKKGLLESTKGKSGGFSLAVNPEDISIVDLIKIFQGPFQLSDHILQGEACSYIKVCYLKKNLDNIEKYAMDKLKLITIASLIKQFTMKKEEI
jgi:Rrf2 family protein